MGWSEDSSRDRGKSLASLLTGKSQSIDREGVPLLFHFPHYFRGPDSVPSTAIIAGNLKLIKFWESNSYKLFNLDEDLGEKNDLAKKHPEKLKELVAVMNNRLRSVNAQLPMVNPDYDPNAPYQNSPVPEDEDKATELAEEDRELLISLLRIAPRQTNIQPPT